MESTAPTAPIAPLSLNGFPLILSAARFKLWSEEAPTPGHREALRATYDKSWLLRDRGGRMLGLPRSDDSPSFGQPLDVDASEFLWLLAARVGELLPETFFKYEPVRRRPFMFLAQKDEIAKKIMESWRVPTAARGFLIQPRYKVESRVVELHAGEPTIGVFLAVSTQWSIETPLLDLQRAGIDLSGLVVVRRVREEGQRRLVGRIQRFDGAAIEYSEGVDDAAKLPHEAVMLEGSREAFARCLRKLLGGRYSDFENRREELTADILAGPGLREQLDRFAGFLRKKRFDLTPTLTATIGDRFHLVDRPHSRCISETSPVEYCFDAARTKRRNDPWTGLLEFGPFSRETLAVRAPSVLVVYPDVAAGAVEQFLATLRDGIPGSRVYGAGFGKIFGFVNVDFKHLRVPLRGGDTASVGKRYHEAIEEYLARGEQPPDVALIFLGDEHAYLPDRINPYLYAKSLLLMAGVPVQSVRMATARQRNDQLQYSLQNLTIATYAKLHGTPWTVDHDLTINDEIVIGIGTCEISGSRFEKRQRFVGITTVFRGDGNYLLGSLSKECAYDEYPDVLRASTTSVLRDLKHRNGWQPGDTVRVVFHSPRPLRGAHVGDIVTDCVKALGDDQRLQSAFVTVSHEHPVVLLDDRQRGIEVRGADRRKGEMAPNRGTIIHLTPHSRLLSVVGPALVKRAVAPLPRPLSLYLHRDSTFVDMWYLAEQTLKFTSLSWKSKLPVREPVTIYYSELIATLLRRLAAVPGWSPALLNVRLRGSRWFL